MGEVLASEMWKRPNRGLGVVAFGVPEDLLGVEVVGYNFGWYRYWCRGW